MSLIVAAGLQTLGQSLVRNWIAPVFLALIAGISIKFLIDRQFRELFTFIVIAMIVALFVYATPRLFGESGIFTKIGEDAAGQLNLIRINIMNLLR